MSSVLRQLLRPDERRRRVARRAHDQDRRRARGRVVGRRERRLQRPVAAAAVGEAEHDVAEDRRVRDEGRFGDWRRAAGDLLVKAVDGRVGLDQVVRVAAALTLEVVVGQRQQRAAVAAQGRQTRAAVRDAPGRAGCTSCRRCRRRRVPASAAVPDRPLAAGSGRRRRAACAKRVRGAVCESDPSGQGADPCDAVLDVRVIAVWRPCVCISACGERVRPGTTAPSSTNRPTLSGKERRVRRAQERAV